MSDDSLEELRRKRLQQMQDDSDASEMMGGEDQEQQMREQLKQIAAQILTKEARSRLGNVRVAKPDLASQIELQLVQLHRMGQIQDKITDEQLKRMLKQIQDGGKDRDIKYSRPR